MPRLKVTVFEPLEIEIGPDVYKIETLSSRMLGEFQKSVEEFGEHPEEVKPEQIGGVLVKILPGMTMEKAIDVDFRHVVQIAKFLADQINEASQPMQAKN